jgi:hypothetical protein
MTDEGYATEDGSRTRFISGNDIDFGYGPSRQKIVIRSKTMAMFLMTLIAIFLKQSYLKSRYHDQIGHGNGHSKEVIHNVSHRAWSIPKWSSSHPYPTVTPSIQG